MYSRSQRGTGRTTKQIKEAPQGAYFVWCNNVLWYPRQLAAKLGREDLNVVGKSWIMGERYYGVDPERIVLDHYIVESTLGGSEKKAYDYFRNYVRAHTRREASS